jgi:hypothetical protein
MNDQHEGTPREPSRTAQFRSHWRPTEHFVAERTASKFHRSSALNPAGPVLAAVSLACVLAPTTHARDPLNARHLVLSERCRAIRRDSPRPIPPSHQSPPRWRLAWGTLHSLR